MKEPKRNPKTVDFLNHQDDHDCVFLAALGMSTQYISEQTGLSFSQVTYRIQKADLTRASGLSRSDFRNGTSPFARIMLQSARTVTDKELRKHLSKI